MGGGVEGGGGGGVFMFSTAFSGMTALFDGSTDYKYAI